VQTIVDNFNVTANAASADIYGIDGDLTARLTDNFKLTLGASYLDAKFDKYPDAVVLVPLAPFPDCRCGNTNVTIDASGNKMPKAPDWTASLVADYSAELTFGLVQLSASLFSTDSFYLGHEPACEGRSVHDRRGTCVVAAGRLELQGEHLGPQPHGRGYTKTSFILESATGHVRDASQLRRRLEYNF
jgi:hypothetical protein